VGLAYRDNGGTGKILPMAFLVGSVRRSGP